MNANVGIPQKETCASDYNFFETILFTVGCMSVDKRQNIKINKLLNTSTVWYLTVLLPYDLLVH